MHIKDQFLYYWAGLESLGSNGPSVSASHVVGTTDVYAQEDCIFLFVWREILRSDNITDKKLFLNRIFK